jgi:hypothetical protein
VIADPSLDAGAKRPATNHPVDIESALVRVSLCCVDGQPDDRGAIPRKPRSTPRRCGSGAQACCGLLLGRAADLHPEL